MMYVITNHKIHKLKDNITLVGICKAEEKLFYYIYLVLSNNDYRLINSKFNKYLFLSVDRAIMFLSKLKENNHD